MGKVFGWVFIFTAILLGSVVAFPASDGEVMGVDPRLIERTLTGVDLVFRRRYDDANHVFEEIERYYPDSPTGLIGKMAVWQIKMFECDDFRFREQYLVEEGRYRDYSLRKLKRGSVATWDLFAMGAADGMRGFFKVREGNWLKSLAHALHAMRLLKEVRWREPDFIDVDLGFGAYKYWRSALTRELNFLPFFGDHREDGIAMLKKVVAQGKYVGDLASANLVFILSNEKRYDKALEIIDDLLAKYPENIIMRYQKGGIKLSVKRYDDVLSIFREIHRMEPAIYKALLYQGIALIGKGDIDGAMAVFREYVREENEKYGLAVGYYWLGLASERRKEISTAASYYKEALRHYKLRPAEARLKRIR